MKLKKLSVGVLSMAVLAVGGLTAFADNGKDVNPSGDIAATTVPSVEASNKGEIKETIKDKDLTKQEQAAELTPSIEAKQ